ncbi:MAG: HAD-IB family phosphatase [Deltaproteobacteria bacterium]|nr:HAD-IB family phosphatase [Deltaproteobacteria bacterium]
MPAPSLILDFDGTLTMVDVGDALCARFADPEWLEIDHRYARGEMSLPDAQRLMWGLFRANREQACAYALEIGKLRPGVDALLDRAQSLGYTLRLASGGFDFYIEAILGPERLARFASVHANSARFVSNAVEPLFAEGLGCVRCAVCKGNVVDRYGASSIFVGDGHSDTCVIGRASQVFAVRDGKLHREALARQAAVTPFADLTEVAERLPRIVFAASAD